MKKITTDEYKFSYEEYNFHISDANQLQLLQEVDSGNIKALESFLQNTPNAMYEKLLVEFALKINNSDFKTAIFYGDAMLLHWLGLYGGIEAIKLMKDHNIDLNQLLTFKYLGPKPIDGTLLHIFAGEEVCNEEIEMLLSAGARTDIENSLGLTPRQLAEIRDNPEVIKILDRHIANLESKVNDSNLVNLTFDCDDLNDTLENSNHAVHENPDQLLSC